MSVEFGTNIYDKVNAVPSLDLVFTGSKKSMTDRISGKNLITFTRTTAATYFDENGVIQTATANTPRFDHDPTTGESLGLLIEEARTNSLDYSEGPGTTAINPGWTQIGSGSIVSAVTLSNGLIGYTLSNTGESYSRRSLSLSALTYTASVYIDTSTDYTGNVISVSGFAGATGTLSATAAAADLSGRVSITFTIAAGDTGGEIRIGKIDNLSGTLSYAGWQLELGSFPTSYIPTDGTPGGIVRGADVARITGTNFSSWYNYPSSTILIDGRPLSVVGSPRLITAAGSGGENRLWATDRGFYTSSYALGGSGMVLTSYPISTSYQRYAYSFDYDASANITTLKNTTLGQAVLSLSSSGYRIPLTEANLYLGGSGDSSGSKLIRRLIYWPTRLTDASLQYLTQ